MAKSARGQQKKSVPKPNLAKLGGMSVANRIMRGEARTANVKISAGGIVSSEEVIVRTEECMLDTLLLRGDLGRNLDAAARLHGAGMWLRTLYIEKAKMAPGGSFRMDTSGGRGEIPDDVAWNMKCFQDTMTACKPYGAMLTAVCCHDDDRYPRNGIATALAKLADHRGM